MALFTPALSLGFFIFLQMHLSLTMADSVCPLDLSGSNFTLAASLCSTKESRGKCCRFINSMVAISVARYANETSNLGVNFEVSEICLRSIAQTLQLYGVTRNATVFCGFGTKIPVNYECQGRTTVTQMLQSPKFSEVAGNCKSPLSAEGACKKCLNAGISYLRNLLGVANNTTLSTCRDATFVALASPVDNATAVDIAGCFFGVQGLVTPPGPSPPLHSPQVSPSPHVASSPTQLALTTSIKGEHHRYHLTLVPVIGIAVTVLAVLMLVILIILIRRKSKQLEESEVDKLSSKAFPPRKFQEGSTCMFRKFGYKETKKATNNFSTIIGQGGFGTVFKAEFGDGSMAAVKRMDKVSKQAEDEFCREIELLARLHHRHLVALRGFCVEKHESPFIFEAPGRAPLNWCTRIQIAIDVANALVADFGLAHASKDGSISFEPVSTDIRGTPGYMDPEYVITQELTEKSDIYSYGVVLLELVTARRAIQDNKNLVEWAQIYIMSDSRITELVDPDIGDSYDFDQLQTLVAIIRWCTQREGSARPSIKQVLRLLYECADPMHNGFVEEYDEVEGRGRTSRARGHSGAFHSGDARCLASSSSTSRSYCSRSFLIESGSPESPSNIPSF
nr:probable receptor-like protein kinase At1g49730 [Ipomoea batatas]